MCLFLFQLSDCLEGVNVETSSSLSVTVATKKSSHSWTFSLLCKVGKLLGRISSDLKVFFYHISVSPSWTLVLIIISLCDCSDYASLCL